MGKVGKLREFVSRTSALRSFGEAVVRVPLAIVLIGTGCLLNPPPPAPRVDLGVVDEIGNSTPVRMFGGWYAIPRLTNPERELFEAWMFQEDEDFPSAIEVLDGALEAYGEMPALYGARGSLLTAMGFLRAAERDFEQAAKLEPEDPQVWCALGRVRLALDLPARAAASLRRARELGADPPELSVLLARCLRRIGRVEHALEEYTKALEDPRGARAEIYREAGKLVVEGEQDATEPALEQACGWLELATRLEPDNPEGWFVRARILALRGEVAGSLGAFERALELDPEAVEVWTHLALFALRAGRGETCLEAADRALGFENDRGRRAALQHLKRLAVAAPPADQSTKR